MATISVFNFMSLDGMYAGPNGDIDWFKDIPHDPEYQAFTQSQATGNNTLVFGRVTYEMMASFWPTDMAKKMNPRMADVMNTSKKIVFSKSLKDPSMPWENVTLMSDIHANAIRAMNENITILGSGSIVQQLANLDLIDSYRFVIVPIVLGSGKAMFKGVKKTELETTQVKAFKNGVVIVDYKMKK